MKYIVTTDCKIEYESTAVIAGQEISGTQSFKCDGKPCYIGNVTVTIPSGSCTSNGYVNVSPIVITIEPSSNDIKSRGMGIVLDGDNATVTTVLANSELDPSTLTVTIKVTIKANQSRVKAS